MRHIKILMYCLKYLQADHLLNPSQNGNTVRPSWVINIPTQSVSKFPFKAINSGLDSNKSLYVMSSLNTGKRYKRETILKFSEGSVETHALWPCKCMCSLIPGTTSTSRSSRRSKREREPCQVVNPHPLKLNLKVNLEYQQT